MASGTETASVAMYLLPSLGGCLHRYVKSAPFKRLGTHAILKWSHDGFFWFQSLLVYFKHEAVLNPVW